MPLKLWHHFENNNVEFKEKGTEYFKCRCDEFIKSPKLIITAFQARNAKAIEVQLREVTAPNWRETDTGARSADAAECLLDGESAKGITAAPLSTDTVACHIKDLAANMKAELVSSLQYSTFVSHTDKSIEVARLAVLLVLI